MNSWNPWHGCKKYSEGCENCYVFRMDTYYSRDPSLVYKTAAFNMPSKRNKNGEYILKPQKGPVFTCLTSDFFIDKADPWRGECWKMMRQREDLSFVIITKRVMRISKCLPPDWGEGYENVTLCATVESQRQADLRLPVFCELPARHKSVICEPLLEGVDLSKYLTDGIKQVTVGGESGDNARICRYEWVLSLRRQCVEANVPFYFKQTGAHFEKDGQVYKIKRGLQQLQAQKANINYMC